MHRTISRALVALATLALAAAPLAAGCSKSHDVAAPQAGATVTIPLAARTVGTRWTKTDDTSTDLVLTAGDQQVKAGGSRHHRTAGEILAVGDGGAMTKVKLTYLERTEHNVGPGAADAALAIAGKSYIAWFDGSAVQATTADGAAVSEDELREIRDDQDDLGQPDVMDQIMARTWTRGERVELTAAELDRLAASKAMGPRATSMSFTLTGVDGDAATFELTMKMTDGANALTIDAGGTAVVDVRTGRPRRLEIRGPITGALDGGEQGPVGVTGSMQSVVTYQFEN